MFILIIFNLIFDSAEISFTLKIKSLLAEKLYTYICIIGYEFLL